jgi:hypothetical protein
MSALDLLVRTIKSQKFGRPFYSKLDEALENLPRQKGTAEEFMRELEKQPGVKKAEIEDRGVKKALAARARAPDAKRPITKEQMQKILYDQAPFPPVIEGGYGGKDVKYQRYSTPGGKNYREILLKLPEDYLNEPYMTDHFGDDPNVLAHIRVSDFNTPDGKKVLLVDEVQSDWHQAGRSEGYKTGKEKAQGQILSKEYDALIQRRKDLLRQAEEMPDGGEKFAALIDEANDITPQLMRMQTQMDELRSAAYRGVPDAPFKKNWHELAMKRVLDYAAGNGYDTVAITPGAEQAKRYSLAKQIDALEWNPEKGRLYAKQKNKSDFDKIADDVTPENLANYIGKEAAEKLIAQPYAGSYKQLNGVELEVGGEGMKGFYDKILPDYLNNFGKQYGASVREAPLNYVPSAQRVAQGEEADALLGQLGVDIPTVAPTQYHMFDITPQLRDEVKNKGLPLYSKMGVGPEGLAAGTGAATIGSEVFDTNNEQQVQNPVHFTENPDAMRLELTKRN